MVWAIWPPMVPAPTTAALKTNMGRQAIGTSNWRIAVRDVSRFRVAGGRGKYRSLGLGLSAFLTADIKGGS